MAQRSASPSATASPAPGVLVACTAIYGFAESTVTLGTGADFVSGTTYTVLVSGERTSFVAQ